MAASKIPELVHKNETELLERWLQAQIEQLRRDRITEQQLRAECSEFLRLFRDAIQTGTESVAGSDYGPLREMLARLSRSRGRQGFSPSDTATFVFSFKRPLFELIRQQLPAQAQAEEMWLATELLDKLGLFTIESHQKAREEVIVRQQEEMLELSTPVVKLWEGVLALPLIGTLDSARTQTVMENLLEKIVEESAHTAILDITGVPTVDTVTAQHLIKTVNATRLMGADCVISGVRPQIAQTIVHLGVNLGDVTTRPSLAGAFAHALSRAGLKVVREKVA